MSNKDRDYLSSYYKGSYDFFPVGHKVSFHYALIEVNKPFFFYIDRYSIQYESQYPISLYAHLCHIPYEKAHDIYRSIVRSFAGTSNPSEHAYSDMERRISTELRERGYDAVIFVNNLYDEILFNSGDLDILDKDQIFYFRDNIQWLD